MGVKKEIPAKIGEFMGIKDVHLYKVLYEFGQDSDTNQDRDEGQTLKIFTEDSGGGSYAIIETERWAVDPEDIDKFAAAIKKIVKIPEEL